jgi:hypothetical protein
MSAGLLQILRDCFAPWKQPKMIQKDQAPTTYAQNSFRWNSSLATPSLKILPSVVSLTR